MLTLIIFILVLGVLVLAHEFGHFIAARKSGMKVEEFGFGFPPRIFGVQFLKGKKLEPIIEVEKITLEETAGGEMIVDEKKEIDVVVPWHRRRLIWGNRDLDDKDENYGTVYSLNWLPLGGFVKIKGENGEAENESDSFMAKPAWKKTIVLAAGVAMNIVLAAVLLSVGYMVGLPQTTDDIADGTIVKDARLAVLEVMPGKPAALAGLKMGDEIVQIGELKNPRVTTMQDYVDKNRDKAIVFTVVRGKETLEKKITPVLNNDTGKGGIGVAIAEVSLVKYPWHKAIYHGVVATWAYLVAIVLAFWGLIVGLFAGRGAGGALAGPVGIAVMTGQVARLGFAYLLQFTAMLSLNLAIINILPIPALDGGRIVFTWLGKIFHKPLFMKFEQTAHTIGFALLMLLVVVVTIKDIGAFKGVFVNLFHRIF